RLATGPRRPLVLLLSRPRGNFSRRRVAGFCDRSWIWPGAGRTRRLGLARGGLLRGRRRGRPLQQVDQGRADVGAGVALVEQAVDQRVVGLERLRFERRAYLFHEYIGARL